MINSSSWAALEAKSYVMCRSHRVVRTIKMETSHAPQKQCLTTYTKFGVDKIVGRGVNEASCLRILKNIKGNLEAANWKCKDIKNISFTDVSISGNTETTSVE